MTISSSSIIISPSIFINTTDSHISASHFRPNTNPRRQSLIASSSSSKSGIELTSVEKKLLLENYGYDPDELLSSSESPSSAAKMRRKKLRLKQRGNEVQEKKAEPKPQRTTHKLLQVLGGKAGRKKLLSPKGMDVRPMMEVVKGAAFAILQAAGGNPISLRPGRWLDLYSGTGSVGIEAISRGCSEVHFVEMDPWVVSDVLRPNLEWTGFLDASVIHTVRVENFLEQAEQFMGKGGKFDYISVTPPYVEVDYEVLMSQVRNSGLIGEDTFIVVEYPIKTEMLDTCGCLVKITDRRFGRTNLVIYGPKWAQKQRKKE